MMSQFRIGDRVKRKNNWLNFDELDLEYPMIGDEGTVLDVSANGAEIAVQYDRRSEFISPFRNSAQTSSIKYFEKILLQPISNEE